MTDRFDSQLRQHLLAIADERPAPGQLAAVVAAVAETGQRPRFVARLTWNPERIGPFPSRAIKLGLVVAGLMVAIVGGALLAGGTHGATSVFEGTWTAADPGDGSTLTLVVGPGMNPAVHFEDDLATGAACATDLVKRFTADGTGVVDGQHLEVTYPNGGGCGSAIVAVHGSFDHDAASDQLVDREHLVWMRSAGGVPPSVPASASPTGPTETMAPSLGTEASPQAGHDVFASQMHGITMDVPAGWTAKRATQPWDGGPIDEFSRMADVISNPADDVHLVIASSAYNRTQDEWRNSVYAWACLNGGAWRLDTWSVDGHEANHRTCDRVDAPVLIYGASRGWAIFLVVSSRDPALVATYDIGWLKGYVATVHLRERDAASADVGGTCTPYPDGGRYARDAGGAPARVDLPGGPESSWSGSRTDFSLQSSPCLLAPAVWMTVSTPSTVPLDACHWRAGGNTAESPALALSTLRRDGLVVTDPVTTRLGGYPATRIELSTPTGLARASCDDNEITPFLAERGIGLSIDPDQRMRLYVVDVDGTALFVAVEWQVGDNAVPAKLAELDAILASMVIGG